MAGSFPCMYSEIAFLFMKKSKFPFLNTVASTLRVITSVKIPYAF